MERTGTFTQCPSDMRWSPRTTWQRHSEVSRLGLSKTLPSRPRPGSTPITQALVSQSNRKIQLALRSQWNSKLMSLKNGMNWWGGDGGTAREAKLIPKGGGA